MMKTSFKKIILGLLVMALSMAAFVTTSDASQAYPVKKISKDVWVTHPGNGYVDYKFTAEAAGYVSVSLKDTGGYTWAHMDFLNGSKEYIDGYYLNSNDKSETVKWAVRADSTYYIRVYDYTSTYDDYTGDAAKVKWTFTKVAFKSNYAKNKAISLEKDKTISVVNTRDRFYDRWYKIKLTKKQAIRYWFKEFNNSGFYVQVFDSKLNEITFITDDADTGKMISSSTQPSGTYYVRIAYYDYYYDDLYQDRAAMCTFKWK